MSTFSKKLKAKKTQVKLVTMITKIVRKPSMVVHACSPGTQEAAAGGLGVQGQPAPIEILPQNMYVCVFIHTHIHTQQDTKY